MSQRVVPLGVDGRQGYATHPSTVPPSTRMIPDDGFVIRDSSPTVISPDGVNEYVPEDLCSRLKKNCFPIIVASMLLIGAIACTTIIVTRSTSMSNDSSPVGQGTTSPTDSNQDEEDLCFVGGIFLNCAKDLPIQIPGCLVDSYNDYKENWIPIHDPTFDHEIDSCAPANLGLIAVASRILAQLNDEQSYALTIFFTSLDGSGWFDSKNWVSRMPLTEWTGVEVNETSGEVLGIELHDNYVSGSLPSQLGMLSSMAYLRLDSNEISGTIPTEYGGIQQLLLASNKLTGTIPVEWSNSSTMLSLDLDSNFLSGSVPHMAQLLKLVLARNEFTSSITVGTNLVDLDLSQNRFTGTMQQDLGTSLARLYLEDNLWDGAAVSLDVLKQLTNLKYLQIGGANIKGTIPTEIGNLRNLTWWQMGRNQISGSLPTEIAQLTNVELIDLELNSLSGTIPSEIGSMLNLTNVYLPQNRFTGSLPSEMGQLKKLRIFLFYGNELSGVIPNEVCSLWDDGDLDLFGNIVSSCNRKPYGGLSCPTEECCRNCPGTEIVSQP